MQLQVSTLCLYTVTPVFVIQLVATVQALLYKCTPMQMQQQNKRMQGSTRKHTVPAPVPCPDSVHLPLLAACFWPQLLADARPLSPTGASTLTQPNTYEFVFEYKSARAPYHQAKAKQHCQRHCRALPRFFTGCSCGPLLSTARRLAHDMWATGQLLQDRALATKRCSLNSLADCMTILSSKLLTI